MSVAVVSPTELVIESVGLGLALAGGGGARCRKAKRRRSGDFKPSCDEYPSCPGASPVARLVLISNREGTRKRGERACMDSRNAFCLLYA